MFSIKKKQIPRKDKPQIPEFTNPWLTLAYLMKWYLKREVV